MSRGLDTPRMAHLSSLTCPRSAYVQRVETRVIGFAVLPFRQWAMHLHWALLTRKSMSTTLRLRGSVHGASRIMRPSHSLIGLSTADMCNLTQLMVSTSIIWQATVHPCVYLRSSAMLPSTAGLAYMAGRFKAAGQRYQAISTVTVRLTWRPQTVRGRRRFWPMVTQLGPCDLSATPAPSRLVRA